MELLSTDLMFLIFKFSKYNDIFNTGLISKKINNFIKNDNLWRLITLRDLTEKKVIGSYKKFYIEAIPFLIEMEETIYISKEYEKIHLTGDCYKDDDDIPEEKEEDKLLMREYGSIWENRDHILHKVAEYGYEICIDKIIKELNISADSCDTEIGTTALHFACINNNNIHCVKKLLSYKVNINERNAYGATPLCYAVINGSLETVDFLLKQKADVNSVSDTEFRMLDENECDNKIKLEIKALIFLYKNKID